MTTYRDRYPIRIGALLWPQRTDWAELSACARQADELGLDSQGRVFFTMRRIEGLRLDEVFERLRAGDPAAALGAGLLDDLCKVIEGLSHFNYVAWRASRDRSVTLLELELQAEVDKFVSTMQLAREKGDTELMRGLHARLFDNPRFHDHLSRRQLERYRAASEYAARFCQALVPRLRGCGEDLLPELRRFYRMSLGDKISHIHAHAWENSPA